jgi:hypothetical protein
VTAAIPIRWSARAVPLTPTAVIACGPVAARLADRLLTFADDLLLRLRGVAGRDLIVLTGESSDLPWLDGVDYLGRDPLAPGLYIPTTLEPTPSVVLLERALRRRAPQLAAPLALMPIGRRGASTQPGEHAPVAEPVHGPRSDGQSTTNIAGPTLSTLRLVSLADARPLARARIHAWRGHG